MIFKIVLSLLAGILIGMEIQDKYNSDTNKFNEGLIKACNDLIKEKDDKIIFYAEYVKYLEGDYTLEFQDALNETLKENINLKRKLKEYE